VPGPQDSWTIAEGKKFLDHNAAKGTLCPCCERPYKIYRRTVNGDMAVFLIRFYKLFGALPPGVYSKIPKEIKPNGGDYAKLRFWGLIEPKPNARRKDGSTRSGQWAMTDLGRRFVRREVSIWVGAYELDGNFLAFDQSSYVVIDQCLEKDFNYNELMTHVPSIPG
jgi:hypothetical protein